MITASAALNVDDKPPEKPEAIASKGKNWKGPSLAGKPNPYVAQGAKGNKGSDKGLGDMGTPTVDFEKTDSKSTVAAQIKGSIKLKIAEAKEKLMKKLKKKKDSVGDELYGDGIASFEDDSK